MSIIHSNYHRISDTVSREWSKISCGELNSLVIRLGYLAVGGNFVCCLIIVAIFIGFGRAYRLGGERGVLKLS